ncbi:MAG: 2-dehydro-3-deoxygalactonokinase [Megamonas funiformis]|uniref:2-dehydro-3-deoxygalactonokinase n=1 Tax=Megamonas funiformis TaxID=437897 RepID=UPI00399496C3
MLIITIDTGTTNTRTRLWENFNCIGESNISIGVRNTAIDGNNKKLIKAIRDTIYDVINKKFTIDKIDLILASGMLTSNVGILEVPHENAPIRLENLSKSMVKETINEICTKPIWFVPGIKNISNEDLNLNNITNMDVMRGEETEAAGLIKKFYKDQELVLILPGSHNKYIFVRDNEILGCMTSLGGELLQALINNTILSDSVKRSFAESFDEKMFKLGVLYSEKYGLCHSAFMTRIISLFGNKSVLEVQNFLIGIVLGDEIKALKNNKLFNLLKKPKFVITGKPVIQKAYECIFKSYNLNVELIKYTEQKYLSGYGLISLAKWNNLIKENL